MCASVRFSQIYTVNSFRFSVYFLLYILELFAHHPIWIHNLLYLIWFAKFWSKHWPEGEMWRKFSLYTILQSECTNIFYANKQLIFNYQES